MTDPVHTPATNGALSLDNSPEFPELKLHAAYLDRAGMAKGRLARIGRLKSEIEELEQRYLRDRSHHDRYLIDVHQEGLASFQQTTLPEKHFPPDQVGLEKAKLEFRQKAVSYLLRKKEDIIRNFRINFVSQHKPKVSYGELIFEIIPDAYLDFASDISPQSAQVLRPYLTNVNAPGFCLYQFCQMYPHQSEAWVDLYSKNDLETFYGHLLDTLYGNGYDLWKDSYSQISLKRSELEICQIQDCVLPTSKDFGVLQNDFRVLFLREQFRESLKATVSPGEGTQVAARLLNHYGHFGRFEEDYQLSEKFYSLPICSETWDAVKSFIGLPTRRSICEGLDRQIDQSWLPRAYQFLTVILEMSELSIEAKTMAQQFSEEFSQIIRQFNSPSANRFSLVWDLCQLFSLAEYSLKQLKGDSLSTIALVRVIEMRE